jgi:hypothetical protein
LLATQLMACESAELRYSLSEISRCDESADCAQGEVCCSMFLFGGASASLCVRAPAPDESPCDFAERCYPGSPCATRGARCVAGYCEKPVANLPCGDAVCSGEKSVCCGDPPRCAPSAECEDRGLRCARPSDCLPGNHCQLTMMGTRCTGMLNLANARVVCESDSDCPRQSVVCKTMRCVPSEHPKIKSCVCP